MIKKLVHKILGRIRVDRFETLNRMEVSRSALLHNYGLFQKLNSDFSVMPVLKSNAYGHGIKQCAEILNDADCDFLVVDGYYEAAKIIDITNHKILVMGCIKSENYELVNNKKCSFVVQDVDSLKAIGNLNKNFNIHIELNTGMNRLGLSSDELDEYLSMLKQFPKLSLEGAMTHLADADNSDSVFTDNQVIAFDAQIDKILNFGFKPIYFHIAQTAGCLIVKSKYANAVRIGIGMYGISSLAKSHPSASDLSDLKPIMKLKSTIIKVIDLKSGDKVSYNGIFAADRAMQIGVLPIGYYEVVPRELSNCGYASVGDRRFQIVGRVCMNHTMIDITDSDLMVGSEVVVINNENNQANSIAQICTQFEIFNYQLMSNITENIKRIITK